MKRLLALIGILAPLPANALTIPIGYSDFFFTIDQSPIVLNATVYLQRDPTICDYCQTGYSDNFTVSFFDGSNSVLQSGTYGNYFYYSEYNDSHGIGAGPIWLNVPATAVTFEIENFLTLTGALNQDGNLLVIGGQEIAPVPVPPALPLFATAVAAMLWRRRRHAD